LRPYGHAERGLVLSEPVDVGVRLGEQLLRRESEPPLRSVEVLDVQELALYCLVAEEDAVAAFAWRQREEDHLDRLVRYRIVDVARGVEGLEHAMLVLQ
jgi:hypothetical protein